MSQSFVTVSTSRTAIAHASAVTLVAAAHSHTAASHAAHSRAGYSYAAKNFAAYGSGGTWRSIR